MLGAGTDAECAGARGSPARIGSWGVLSYGGRCARKTLVAFCELALSVFTFGSPRRPPRPETRERGVRGRKKKKKSKNLPTAELPFGGFLVLCLFF